MNKKLSDISDRLLSQERGTVFKDPGGKINIALAYPNTYQVGMSSLGFQGIYGLLNRIPDVVCERVFLPAAGDIPEYERTATELFSLESKRPLSRFDIIAFSVSFENDYPNIVKMLHMSGVPVRSADRKSSHPVVLMGGVCTFYNPEPVADFMDLCFVGEAEEMLPEFLSVFRGSESKKELFLKASGIEGLYVPAYYSVGYSDENGQLISRQALNGAPERIKKRRVSDISKSHLRTTIYTPESEFSNMCLVEAMRGCVWSCRFCVAGHIYKPARIKTLDVLNTELEYALSETGRVGLIGPSLSDYPHVTEVLSREGVDFSITSLRASPRSAAIVGLMKGHRSISIAPEAGTQRLRDVINKKITEEGILETARLILGGDIETLRLYFMIGLPTETREDIAGICDIVSKVRENSKRGHITVSVSTFVPKPFTPFQWHPMMPLKEVKDRLLLIKKGLSRLWGVKVFHDVPKYAHMQGMFSLGDRRVSMIIEELAETDGANLNRVLAGDKKDFYIFRKRHLSEMLPWDFIDIGVARERLWEEYLGATGQ